MSKTLVLLPGLDGTDIFLQPLLGALPPDLRTVAVTYPAAGANRYADLLPLVRAAVEKSSLEKDRLMLWGRRLLGEAITQAQHVMAQQENLADLVITATGDLTNIAALFDRMQIEHAKRMAVLGLH